MPAGSQVNVQRQKPQRMRQFSVSCITNISIIVGVLKRLGYLCTHSWRLSLMFEYPSFGQYKHTHTHKYIRLIYLLFVESNSKLSTQMELLIKFITHINFQPVQFRWTRIRTISRNIAKGKCTHSRTYRRRAPKQLRVSSGSAKNGHCMWIKHLYKTQYVCARHSKFFPTRTAWSY